MWCRYAFKHSTGNYNCCDRRGIVCPLTDSSDEIEVRKCEERTSLCGFLAPDGTFYQCPAYGHMSEAERITQTVLHVHLKNGVDAERFLLMKGYVAFYARRVGFLATGVFKNCGCDSEERVIRLLTDEQIAFLEDALTFCNLEEKRNCMKEILEEDRCLKTDPYYHNLMSSSLD